MNTNIEFLGAAGEVTGSSYLVHGGSCTFLVDCGLHQGEPGDFDRNMAPFSYKAREIDFLLLTHAHLDHCGLIPKLYHEGFRGPIYCTPATADLTACILLDSANIQEHEGAQRHTKILYDVADANGALALFKTHPYQQAFEPSPGVKVQFQNAGHILGSASIEVWVGDTKVVFSGDLGNAPAPIMPDPAVITEANIVLCESTYGDRNHDERDSREDQLLKAIQSGLQRGGKVIIPCFAVDRTQQILYILNQFKNRHVLPDNLPVILDSPLAIKVTAVYQKYESEFDADFQAALKLDSGPFGFPGYKQTVTRDESMTINSLKGPAVIIAGSGMADAGRVQHHLLHHLSDPATTVIFVGFQAPGTLGSDLTKGNRTVLIMDEHVHVNAHILEIGAFSGHADQTALLGWLGHFTSKPRVFLTHGEDSSRETLAPMIKAKLGLSVEMPHGGDTSPL